MAPEAAHDLDDPGLYQRWDPSGLRTRIRQLPGHCWTAWQQAYKHPFPAEWTSIDKVVIGGMGGSAIAGDLTADLAAAQKGAPISVVRDLSFPFTLDERTLFVACSYSGSTEETLSLFSQATSIQAKVIAISSGGELAKQARNLGTPLLTVDIIGEPRSAVGYNLLLLLGSLSRLGLVKIAETKVSAAVESLYSRLAGLQEDVPTADNPAKQLALELRDKVILVYGSGLFSGLARRWKTQFNENAKAWAFHELIPEVLHNAVEAYPTSLPATGRLFALLLQPETSHGGHGRHYRVVSQLLHRNEVPHRVLQAENSPPLQQLLEMMLLGDYVSYYLALIQGVDPSPVPSITAGKELLANDQQ